MCAAYEYVADSEEATLSQSESVRSLCSVDDAEFRSKTQQFFEGMARLRHEVEAEHKAAYDQQKTSHQHTVSRSFYPRRVSDNVTHRTNVMLEISSPKPEQPTGAEMYQAFSKKLLLVPDATVDRRRSASAASEGRVSQELDQLLMRPGGAMERSLSVTSTPSTLQRPLSRQSESEESITMVDVTWQHRKPAAVRRRQRPHTKHWEETDSETLSVVRTSKKDSTIGKRQQETVHLRPRERSRRDEIAKELEMVEQQERKIKEELAKQQKALQQFTAERRQQIERERIEDFVRQQELVKEQESIRKQELRRLSEIQEQHELAKKLAFQAQRQQPKVAEQIPKAEKVAEKTDTRETSFISIDVTAAPVTPVKSTVEQSTERTTLEAVKSPPESHKLEMVVERPVTPTPPLGVVEPLDMVAKVRNTDSCGESAFADEFPDLFSFSGSLHEKVVASQITLESPATVVESENIRTALSAGTEAPSEQLLEVDGATVSVATEVIHSEELIAPDILSPQDLQVVELVEQQEDVKPTAESVEMRHSQSSEDDVFFDASDVDAHSAAAAAADATEDGGQLMLTGSLLMAPVFELPLADVTAFDGAGHCCITFFLSIMALKF